jgi:hypothetical protein
MCYKGSEEDLPEKTLSADLSSKAVDNLLSAKLNKMSMEQRSDGLYDLHGVADLENETPEMIQEKMEEINEALALSCTSNSVDSRDYEKAYSMSREHVEKIKRLCLRAEIYNSEEASARVLRFFTRKRELFGEERLVRDITMRDLGEEATTLLRRGLWQLLPQRDRAGRAILFLYDMETTKYENISVVSPRSDRGRGQFLNR